MTQPTSRKAAQRKLANRELVSTKLTDAQRIILPVAAQRDDGVATLSEGMTEKAAHKLAAALIQKGLAREIRAKADIPVWRRNEEGRACALIVTKLGREAIKGDDDRQTVDAGLEAPAPSSTASAACSETAVSSQTELSIPRQGSKLADVMALLSRKQGAGASAQCASWAAGAAAWSGVAVRHQRWRDQRLFVLVRKEPVSARKVDIRLCRVSDQRLRTLLIVGATSIIKLGKRGVKLLDWLAGLVARKPFKVVAVALANKMARIIWAL